MASVVFALLPDAANVARAEAAIRIALPRGTLPVLRSFDRAPLEGNDLPEPATEFGRNLLWMTGGGAAAMGIAGAVAGAFDLMLGMTVALGLCLGTVTGALMGFVGAMQAGTRRAKEPLRGLEPRICDGRVLVVLEVSADHVDAAIESLERSDAEHVGVLRAW